LLLSLAASLLLFLEVLLPLSCLGLRGTAGSCVELSSSSSSSSSSPPSSPPSSSRCVPPHCCYLFPLPLLLTSCCVLLQLRQDAASHGDSGPAAGQPRLRAGPCFTARDIVRHCVQGPWVSTVSSSSRCLMSCAQLDA
jgi:hypothetical protein